MSIRDLLQPETKTQEWAKLYAFSVEAGSFTAGGISQFDTINVAGDAFIGPNNFQLHDAGLSGQVLTTDGTGVLSWQSNGDGNVVGPVSSVANNVTVFADGTGKLLADSGIPQDNIMLTPAAADLDMDGFEIHNINQAVFPHAAVLEPPPPGANAIFTYAGDSRLWCDGANHARIVLEGPFYSPNFGGLTLQSQAYSSNTGAAGTVLKADGLGGSDWKSDNIGRVIYKPGGVSSGITKATWAEVVAYVDSYAGCVIVYVDDSITSPAPITSDLDCHGMTEFYAGVVGAKLVINDGFKLINPRRFVTVSVKGISTALPSFQFGNGALCDFLEGAILTNDVTTLVPLIQIPDASGFVLLCTYGGGVTATAAVPIVQAGVNSTLIFPQFVMANPGSLTNDIFSSVDGTATLIFQGDASKIPITNAGFTGSIIPLNIDKAAFVKYDDSVTPPVGVTTVQDAIDVLKAEVRTYSIGFGGDFAAILPLYANVWGDSASLLGAVAAAGNTAIAPTDGLLRSFTYSTESADGTSTFHIYVNGVDSATVVCSGVSGIAANIDVAVVAGQSIQVVQTAGTPVDQASLVVYFSSG